MRPAIRLSARLGAAAAALGLLAGLSGCAKVDGTMAPNRPPETTLWVTGEVDTVAHTQHFYWDGQDPDGQVVGFEFKWVYESGAEPVGYDSTVWTFTTDHDSIFAVWTPNGLDFPTLLVRAVDDKGARDETPARQQYRLSNLPPTITLTSTPPPTTLPAAYVAWSIYDPDGIVANAHCRVWLDGRADHDTIVAGTGVTLPGYFFQEVTGEIQARRRTVYVSAIDDGGAASPPDSFSWNVVPPAGTTLLVDEMPGSTYYDTFYRTELDTRLGSGHYSVIDLSTGTYFPTADAIRETFLLFDDVFWCAENNPNLSAPLGRADQPIRDYLAAGGNLFLASSRVVGTGGALGEDFQRDVLGATELRVNQLNGTTGFVISPGQFLIGGQSPFDSLQSAGIYSGVESFVMADPAEAAYLAPPGTLDTLHVDDWVVAVSRRYGSGQGKLVYLAFPLRGLNYPFSGVSDHPAVELRKIFDLFGM